MKSVAISQSNYIPWKGYFDMINRVDEFILLDDVQYTRSDWRNRNLIKMEQGLQWVTIPVESKGEYHQRICDTLVHGSTWRVEHPKAIKHAYARTDYYTEITDILRPLYEHASNRLSEINEQFIRAICAYLGIETTISHSWAYPSEGQKTQKLLSICKQCGADIYYSGPAAKAYLDEELLRKNKIEVRYIAYEGYPTYPQLYPPFEHKVSIIDLLCNMGKEAPDYMLSF